MAQEKCYLNSFSDSPLTNTVVKRAFTEKGLQHCGIDVFDTLPSTNAYLSELAKRAIANGDHSKPGAVASPHAARQVCVADWQTSGVGRRGKQWNTARGNVTFSLLLQLSGKPAEFMGLSLVTGLCVAESIAELAQIQVQLKWPNDILVNDMKLCGLLTELIQVNEQYSQIVAGIGINYTPQAVLAGADYQSTSLPEVSQVVPERATLIADICARIEKEYSVFSSAGWSGFAKRWSKFDYLCGRDIRVISGETEQHAVAVGVDDKGALLVKRDGVLSSVYSGEVSVRVK